MRYHWLIKNKAEDLIIFFNGWSMDEKPFTHLKSTKFDVLILYDYRSLVMPQDVLTTLQPYKEIYLAAYSMGVWVSQHMLNQLPGTLAYSLAINGTLNPIDNRYGIPTTAYDEQISSFNDQSMNNFYSGLITNDSEVNRFMQNLPQRNWQDQLDELIKLKEHITADPLDRTTGQFDAAIISSQDNVLLARNQLRFWKNQSNYKIIDNGHFPFYRWSTWEALFDEV